MGHQARQAHQEDVRHARPDRAERLSMPLPEHAGSTGRAIGVRVGEEFLYWLKLRLRRRKARGPAAGTPRCGRRWRAVLAHPAAPALYDELMAEPALLTTLSVATSVIGRHSGAWTREAPAVAAQAQSHGGPLPTPTATRRPRPARLSASSAFCAAPWPVVGGWSMRKPAGLASAPHVPPTCPRPPSTAMPAST